MNISLIEAAIQTLQNSTAEFLELKDRGACIQLRRPATTYDVLFSPNNLGSENSESVEVANACGRFFNSHPLEFEVESQSCETLEKGDVLGYLQVGEMLSSVCAGASCHVVERLIPDGTLVGWGTPVMRIRSAIPK